MVLFRLEDRERPALGPVRHTARGPKTRSCKHTARAEQPWGWGQGLHSPVQDGLPAAIQVVKFLFGHRVVHIHGRHAELPSFGELVQPGRGQMQVRADSSNPTRDLQVSLPKPLPVHTGHALLHNPSDLLEYVGVLLINPMGQIPTIVQYLENSEEQHGAVKLSTRKSTCRGWGEHREMESICRH